MTTDTFDTLSAAREFEAAGIERRRAEAIAEGMRRAIASERETLATKADLAELKADMLKVAIGSVVANAGPTFAIVKLP